MNKLYKTSLTIMMLFISFLAKAQDVVKIDAESSARYEQDYSYYLMYLFLLATIFLRNILLNRGKWAAC